MTSTPAIVQRMNVLLVSLVLMAHGFPLMTQMAGIRASWNVRIRQELHRDRDRAARGCRRMVSTSSKTPTTTWFVTGTGHVGQTGTCRMWGPCAAAASRLARIAKSF